jgi:AcrR family transcriptional regulator
VPTQGSLRERRRGETVAEIKQAAMRELASSGPDGLSLRAVAREVGVSVQALYHYFASRDALLTALVADAHNGLADAVMAAGEASAGGTPRERFVAVGLAYRRWAVENRGQFLLIYGVPLPDYHAPEGGPTTVAAQRLGEAFSTVLFEGWTAQALARVPLPARRPEFETHLTAAGGSFEIELPPGALALFVSAWGQLHGLVMLEVLNHLPWLGPTVPDLLEVALIDQADRFQAARRGDRGRSALG